MGKQGGSHIKLVKCPHCGADIPEQASFCPVCFRILVPETLCENTPAVFKRALSFGMKSIVALPLLLMTLLTLTAPAESGTVILNVLPTVSDTVKASSSVPSTPDGTTERTDSFSTPLSSPRENDPTAQAEKGTDSPTFEVSTFRPEGTPSNVQYTPIPGRTVTPRPSDNRTPVPIPKESPLPTIPPTPSPLPKGTPPPENCFQYKVVNNTAVITNYSGSDVTLYLPETLNGYRVSEIASMGRNNTVRNLSVPMGLNSYQEDAFAGLTRLQHVELPDSVTDIPPASFRGVSELRYIKLPASVYKVSGLAFYGCTSLKYIILPKGVQHIDTSAFNQSGLEQIVIPASVQTLQDFIGAGQLRYIEVEGGDNGTYFSEEGVLFSRDGPASIRILTYPVKKETAYYELPSYVTYLGGGFQGNSYLQRLSLTGKIATVPYRACAECTGLTTVILGEQITDIGEQAFAGCVNLAELRLGRNIQSIASDSFSGCGKLTLTVEAGSYAQKYAIQKGIPYRLS